MKLIINNDLGLTFGRNMASGWEYILPESLVSQFLVLVACDPENKVQIKTGRNHWISVKEFKRVKGIGR